MNAGHEDGTGSQACEGSGLRRWDVACGLSFEVGEGTRLAFQIAPAATEGQTVVDERLELTLDGAPLGTRVVELRDADGGRTHLVTSGAGRLVLSYAATVAGLPVAPVAAWKSTPARGPAPRPDDGTDIASIVALRQSRYCPSDLLAGFAASEFSGLPADDERAASVARWVFHRLSYELGSSGPYDTAVETLLRGVGVCRDFAHLTITLCRAIGIPARLVAVYAPGLSPMDFHAVVEVRRGDGWEVLDATRLTSRHGLLRLATGRDASDTAFATTLEGNAELLFADILAVLDGEVPVDDQVTPLCLP